MRKVKTALILASLCCMFSVDASALTGDTVTSGAMTIARTKRTYQSHVTSLSWTSDASGNVTADIASLNGTILRVVTNPDDTDAPTANYDIVLNDQDGIDLLSGLGANRHTANSESVTPFEGDGTAYTPMVSDGTATLLITNAGNAKSGVVRLYIRPGF